MLIALIALLFLFPLLWLIRYTYLAWEDRRFIKFLRPPQNRAWLALEVYKNFNTKNKRNIIDVKALERISRELERLVDEKTEDL